MSNRKGSKSTDKAVKAEGVDKGEQCLSCSSVVRDNDLALQCEVCDAWCHTKCENISEEVYKALQVENIHWYCARCNKGIGKILLTLSKVQLKQENLEKKQEKLEKSQEVLGNGFKELKQDFEKTNGMFDSYKSEIQSIRVSLQEVSDSVKCQRDEHQKLVTGTEDDSPWTTIVKKQVSKQLANVTEEIQEAHKSVTEAKDYIDEEKEKDKRKNNIIIYRMEESKSADFETRMNEDYHILDDLFRKVLQVDCRVDKDITNILRLGKKESDKSRPLLVSFRSGLLKNQVMESLAKLADASAVFKNLSITHDMTLRERQRCKELLGEAKRLEEEETSGEWIFRVRGAPVEMKIVRLRKRRSEPPMSADRVAS